MIAFEHVTKRYGERLALDDVSWRMDEGECVVVLGHSAAGKTTLLRLITHETQPTTGLVARRARFAADAFRARTARCCAARSGSSTRTSACWAIAACSRTSRWRCGSRASSVTAR